MDVSGLTDMISKSETSMNDAISNLASLGDKATFADSLKVQQQMQEFSLMCSTISNALKSVSDAKKEAAANMK